MNWYDSQRSNSEHRYMNIKGFYNSQYCLTSITIERLRANVIRHRSVLN